MPFSGIAFTYYFAHLISTVSSRRFYVFPLCGSVARKSNLPRGYPGGEFSLLSLFPPWSRFRRLDLLPFPPGVLHDIIALGILGL